jgi:acyl-CoA synthetase (AMP-forming)/AMP-acid ligase II
MDMTVVDPSSNPLTEVPRDGVTIGEVAISGNGVMMGYLGNEAATREVFRDGYGKHCYAVILHRIKQHDLVPLSGPSEIVL